MRVALGTKEGRDRREYQWVDAAKKHGGVRVGWARLRWAGVPEVLRPGLEERGVAAHKLEGCGCIVPLKALWLRTLRRAMTWRTRRKLRAVLAKWRRTKRAVDRARAW